MPMLGKSVVIAVFGAILLVASAACSAQTQVVFCEGCSPSQKMRAAIRAQDNPGRIGVGDRRTGELEMFRVRSKTLRSFSIVLDSATQKERDEFFAYSDAYRQRGRIGYIGIKILLPEATGGQISQAPTFRSQEARSDLMIAAVPPPEGMPGKNLSGFDLVKDGPLRQRFLAWASDISNWPGMMDPLSVYAKLIVGTGRSLYTGAEFQIGAEFVFKDGSYTTTYYSSSSQRLEISEIRDSVGNLIYTDSKDEVPVDYTSYMWPEAFARPDYARGIDFLWTRGAMTSSGQVRRGTVIVKDMVIVRDGN